MTPPRLAPWYQRLPPILHKPIQKSMPSYSKGARGLSVLLRVAGIFTGTTNSLSLSSRQRPTRCAIHAGRNLPDKVLRYLRTVHIVTFYTHPKMCFKRVKRSKLHSLCHHRDRTVSSLYITFGDTESGVLVSEDSSRF